MRGSTEPTLLIFLPFPWGPPQFWPEHLGSRPPGPACHAPHRMDVQGMQLDHFMICHSWTIPARTRLEAAPSAAQTQLIPSNPQQTGETEQHRLLFPLAHSICSHTFGLKNIFSYNRIFKAIKLDVFCSKPFFTIYNDDWKECNLITSFKKKYSIFREENSLFTFLRSDSTEQGVYVQKKRVGIKTFFVQYVVRKVLLYLWFIFTPFTFQRLLKNTFTF